MGRGLLIGIDGGASKTVCALVDPASEQVWRGVSGSANFFKNGVYGAKSSLREAVESALSQAEASPSDVSFACAGLAGVSRPEDRKLMEQVFGEILPGVPVRVENDGLVALAGATEGRPGVIVISGTGSIALGVNRLGQRAQAGGWGFLVGDEGSGYDIARRGIMAALQDFDGRGPKTSLRAKLIRELYLPEIDQIIPLIYLDRLTHANVAALYPVMMQAAEEGDPVAGELIRSAAGKLARMATAVLKRLGDPASTPVAVAGGVISHSPILAATFRERVCEAIPEARFIEARHPPEIGAVLIARALAEGREAFSG